MREISKRKWPKPASRTLAAIKDKVPGFWRLIFRDVNNILTSAFRHGPYAVTQQTKKISNF